MREKNSGCEAKISPDHSLFLKIWYILALVLLIAGSLPATEPSSKGEFIFYRLFFFKIGYRFKYTETVRNIKGNVIHNIGDTDAAIWFSEELTFALIIIAALAIIPILLCTADKFMASGCSLTLTNKGVSGKRKQLFSSADLDLPINKINSASVSNGIKDKLVGGSTVVIRTATGMLRFPYVQNAREFVEAVMSAIEKSETAAANENKKLISAVVKNTASNAAHPSAASKIKEIKDLLDSGLITQEEFEAKRKELLEKI